MKGRDLMNTNNQKKKSTSGAGIWILIIVIALISNIADSNGSSSGVLAAVFFFIFIFIAVFLLIKRAKAKKQGSAYGTHAPASGTSVHSHDRITGYTDNSCDGLTHWKKQLDGFLKAGIIDKNEYNTLMRKYVDTLSRTTYR